MANKQRGELSIKLNGKEYTMRPTFDAMCEMEDRLSGTMPEIVVRIENGDIKFKNIATIVWCGIHGFQDDGFTDDVSPTISEIGNAIRVHGLTKLLSEGIEENKNPIVKFLALALMGDEEAEKLEASQTPKKPKPKAADQRFIQ